MRIAPEAVIAYRAGDRRRATCSSLADIQVKYAQMLRSAVARRVGAARARSGRRRGRGLGHAHGRAALARRGAGRARRAPATARCSSAAASRPATRARCSRCADGAIVGTSLMTDGRATPEQVRRADRGARVKFVCAGDCGDRPLRRPRDRARGRHRAERRGARCAGSARPATPSVALVAPVGDDAGAEVWCATRLARAGVESCLEVVPGATPVQHIRQAPDGERVFERYDEGVLAGYRVSERQREAIAALRRARDDGLRRRASRSSSRSWPAARRA